MTQSILSCVPSAALDRYAKGYCNAQELSQVSLHLLRCAECVERLAQFTQDDPWTVELKASLQCDTKLQIDADCDRWMKQVTSMLSSAGSAESAGLDTESASTSTQSFRPALSVFEKREAAIPLSDQYPSFERYRIVRFLGRGGMGDVFEAIDLRLNRTVAIKVPHADIQASSICRTRFQNEARAAAAVTHPHICGIIDIGEEHGVCYLTMPMLQGKTLAEWIQSPIKLPLRDGLDLIKQTCLAVDALHRHGILHRDIKPSNIFVESGSRAVLMDFGLASGDFADERLTHSGALIGTPAYFSPEQATGDGTKLTPQSDLYSLGVVFYEFLSGKRPFTGPAGFVIGEILHVAAPPLVSRYEGCNASLVEICERAMAKSPADRFASARQFHDAIDAWQQAQPTSFADSAEFKPPISRQSVGLGGWAVGVALAILAFILIIKTPWGSLELRASKDSDANDLRLDTKEADTKPTNMASDLTKDSSSDFAREGMHDQEYDSALAQLHPTWIIPFETVSSSDTAAATAAKSMAETWSLSRDGRLLAVLCQGPRAEVWDLESRQKTASWKLPPFDSTLAFATDGSRLLTAGGGWRLRVWDWSTQTETLVLAGHKNWINTILVSQQNEFSVTSSRDGTVRRWNLNTGKEEWVATHGGWARGIAFIESESSIASIGRDGRICIWNAKNGMKQSEVQASNRPLANVASSADGQWLVTVDDEGELVLWDAKTLQSVWRSSDASKHIPKFAPNSRCMVYETTAQQATGTQLMKLDLQQLSKETSARPLFESTPMTLIGFGADGDDIIALTPAKQLVSIPFQH